MSLAKGTSWSRSQASKNSSAFGELRSAAATTNVCSSMHVPLPTLPVELIQYVLTYAQTDDILPRYKYLKSYSLFSRAVGSFAQTLLFTRIHLKSVQECGRLKRSLNNNSE